MIERAPGLSPEDHEMLDEFEGLLGGFLESFRDATDPSVDPESLTWEFGEELDD